MPKHLTKKQKNKADKITKLIKELADENITFYMNSMPDLQIGFLRDADSIDGFDDFFNFLNKSKDSNMYYSPRVRLKLDGYAA